MKKILLQVTNLVVIMTVLLSCVKDKGNYELHEIPGVSSKGYTIQINGNPIPPQDIAKLIINTNDRLQISFNEDIAGGVDPVYQWMMYEIDPILKPGAMPESSAQIALTKDFDQSFSKGPGKYKLYRKLTNRNNGDAYFSEFIIEVESINGLLVYQEDGNKRGEYSSVRTVEMNLGLPSNKMGVRHQIYSSLNPTHPVENPTQLWLRQVNAPTYSNQIFAISANGATQINYRTHQWEHSNKEALFAFPLEGSFMPQGHMNGSNKTEYLVQNEQVFSIDYTSGPSVPKFAQLSEAGMAYAPYMMTIPTDRQTFRLYSNVVFNKTLQRFEYDNFGNLTPFFYAPGNLGQSDVDISATQMNLIYLAKGKDYYIDAIMEQNTGTINYIRFDITDPMAATCTHNIALSALSDQITKQSLWAVSERGPLAFFATDNKIYTLNYENKTAELSIADLPVNAKISVLKILKDKENPAYDNAILYIAYNQGDKGTLLQYEFNPLSGQLNISAKKTFDGFGKILDLTLKK
ncbi:hypothetical protein [Pedobacter nyackensis]|uniref:PKD-like family protein n=1 Tax=Pedobacter nyackensis TaxID=475255 RepID=A0A1W2CPS8_9SPHI|nr:hypothetical protein [Pedobacter nyackensis]SMC87267.1 hypothetical protein SAMN04488101_104160 [Pedobacter nyackensis]